MKKTTAATKAAALKVVQLPLWLLLLSSLSLINTTSFACSELIVTSPHGNIAVRHQDSFKNDEATLVIYPRGIKRDQAGYNLSKPLTWTSKYGSVVMMAMHKGSVDGMNEKGLNAAVLYLQSNYEATDERPELSNMLWVQYLLDNYATVGEALAAPMNYRVVSAKLKTQAWPLHLVMHDAAGNTAIIEYINGEQKIYHNSYKGLPVNVMTNDPPYEDQIDNLCNYALYYKRPECADDDPENGALPGAIDPMSRFVRLKSFAKMLPEATSHQQVVEHALGAIQTVTIPDGAVNTRAFGNPAVQSWPTLWTSMRDPKAMRYAFIPALSMEMGWLDFDQIDFAKGAPMRTLSIYQKGLSGNVLNKMDQCFEGEAANDTCLPAAQVIDK